MLLPRMIFNDIVIGKKSDEEFINSIDNKYGDVNAARKCAKDYLNMLNVEKVSLQNRYSPRLKSTVIVNESMRNLEKRWNFHLWESLRKT